MAFDYEQATTARDELLVKWGHITRSALARQLLEHEARDQGEVVILPFEGDADKAHVHTRSIRKTMGRLGRRLYYKREPGRLLLWARKDDAINPADFITKPRRKPS